MEYNICPVENIACKKNTDCNSGEFCNLAYHNAESNKPDTGTCTPIGEINTLTYINGANKTFMVSPYSLAWWGAENWCQAQGKHLVSYTTLNILFGCNKNDGMSCDWDVLRYYGWRDERGLTYFYWTSEGDSSFVWVINAVAVYFGKGHRSSYNYALCE